MIKVRIENTYSNGHSSWRTAALPPPGPSDDDLEDWWEETAHAETGDGTGLDSKLGFLYEATIVESTDSRLPVGECREWSG